MDNCTMNNHIHNNTVRRLLSDERQNVERREDLSEAIGVSDCHICPELIFLIVILLFAFLQ